MNNINGYFYCPVCTSPAPTGYFATVAGLRKHHEFAHHAETSKKRLTAVAVAG